MAIQIRRKIRAPEEIPLASTADIAFLLIIFFLAASALLELKGVKLPIPKKDAPPIQVESKNLIKINITKDQSFIYENKSYNLKEVLEVLEAKFRQNPEMIVSIKVDPECPTEIIPKFLFGLKRKNIYRFSMTMAK
ncbi:MAG: biopolymer transporter ExbD [Leptospiraceae bacterium]|nr:biopolymer transporter ExbD [Leptospiraceae bacterium]MDW7975433.1 biopolymer transporter ExbD [Leptospiraceae bacterium]